MFLFTLQRYDFFFDVANFFAVFFKKKNDFFFTLNFIPAPAYLITHGDEDGDEAHIHTR